MCNGYTKSDTITKGWLNKLIEVQRNIIQILINVPNLFFIKKTFDVVLGHAKHQLYK
jgi:hypothetical protein